MGYTCEPFTAIQVADVEDHNVNEGVAVGTANFGTPKNWIFSPSFFPKINLLVYIYNKDVLKIYNNFGFEVDVVTTSSCRLIND